MSKAESSRRVLSEAEKLAKLQDPNDELLFRDKKKAKDRDSDAVRTRTKEKEPGKAIPKDPEVITTVEKERKRPRKEDDIERSESEDIVVGPARKKQRIEEENIALKKEVRELKKAAKELGKAAKEFEKAAKVAEKKAEALRTEVMSSLDLRFEFEAPPNAKRLNIFDIESLVSASEDNNVVAPAVDAACQILATKGGRYFYIPHDHMDGSKEDDDIATELKLAKNHLAMNDDKPGIIIKVTEITGVSLGYTEVRDDGRIEIHLNSHLFNRNLEGGERPRAIVVCAQTILHEIGHAKPRLISPDIYTPRNVDTFKAKGVKKYESGFCLTEAMFGGDLLPASPTDGSDSALRATDFKSPKIWKKYLRFATTIKKGKSNVKVYPLVSDDWVREFVSRTRKGEWTSYINSLVGNPPTYDKIILLPDTQRSKDYTNPPTFEEVSALCYGVINEKAERKQKRK